MDTEQRVRVEFSDRSSRGWCAGATRPPVRQELETATGWTSFFKLQNVVGRLRRAGAKGEDLESVESALPQGSSPMPESVGVDEPEQVSAPHGVAGVEDSGARGAPDTEEADPDRV